MKLDGQDHRSLALLAADCAGRVLPYFEGEHPGDERPRRAIEAGQAWARGEIKVGEARAAAIAAHASAREGDGAAARAAARATGHHAAATAHMAVHARHAANYAARAVAYDAASAAPEAARRRRETRSAVPSPLGTPSARGVSCPMRATARGCG
jgi:immunity protein 5 of polymorphic toxin system